MQPHGEAVALGFVRCTCLRKPRGETPGGIGSRVETRMLVVDDDPSIERRPLLDFSAGYVLRSLDGFPQQGSSGPWAVAMDYRSDRERLIKGPVADAALRFGTTDRVSAAAGAATA